MSIYDTFPKRADATMELVDAISSNQSASSVVQLSQEPLFRRKHSSINDAIDNLANSIEGSKTIHSNFEELLIDQIQYSTSSSERGFHLFALDATQLSDVCPVFLFNVSIIVFMVRPGAGKLDTVIREIAH